MNKLEKIDTGILALDGRIKSKIISKKAECNIIGIIGLAVAVIGFLSGSHYISGIGSGIVFTALHFRVDYL